MQLRCEYVSQILVCALIASKQATVDGHWAGADGDQLCWRTGS